MFPVPHDKLILLSFACTGIFGPLLQSFLGYLKNKRVVLDGESSSLVVVPSGVPQGSILGPKAFVGQELGESRGIFNFYEQYIMLGNKQQVTVVLKGPCIFPSTEILKSKCWEKRCMSDPIPRFPIFKPISKCCLIWIWENVPDLDLGKCAPVL